ncbi:DUF982 domain-containing protein [Mesorhizobium sp. BR115XR7A]|nr:DUF982 domain-containing protein [Mesorhizobium sp. BR115XR7A]MBZ9933039.1 DUF982 domain-containing protein [Mesorhizobium sp. BR1-1-5]
MNWISPPVHVRDINSAGLTIIWVNSVERCIEVLQTWSVNPSPPPKMLRAREVCYGAAEDPPTYSAEQAREAFEAAAKEAKVLF